METSETSQPISSSEQTDNSDGDVPIKNGSDTEQGMPMETDHPEKIDDKGTVFRML